MWINPFEKQRQVQKKNHQLQLFLAFFSLYFMINNMFYYLISVSRCDVWRMPWSTARITCVWLYWLTLLNNSTTKYQKRKRKRKRKRKKRNEMKWKRIGASKLISIERGRWGITRRRGPSVKRIMSSNFHTTLVKVTQLA